MCPRALLIRADHHLLGMITKDQLPKWLTEEDPALKLRAKSEYCRKHNFWYWMAEGCSCCEDERKGLLPPTTTLYPPRY
jgi:hypothetical protein